MIEISKKLLSEVLKYSVDKYKIVSSNEITQIRIWKKDAELWDYRSYDIYHLAHKCKEWALSKGYLIGLNARQGVTLIDINTNRVLRYITIDNLEQTIRFELNLCEWILEENK